MYMTDEEFKHLIYELVCGSRNLEDFPVKESLLVENEFEEGKFCNRAYDQIFNANRSLCNRLDEEEDIDVECIISNFMNLTKHLCFKMYDYGSYYTQQKYDENTEKISQLVNSLPERKREKFMKAMSSLVHTINDKSNV